MTDTLRSKTALKALFETGDQPVGSDFDDLITTFVAQGGKNGSTAHAIQTNDAISAGASGVFASGANTTGTGDQGLFAQGSSATCNGSLGLFVQGRVATTVGSFGAFTQGDNCTSIGGYGNFVQGGGIGPAVGSGIKGVFAQGVYVNVSGAAGAFAQGTRSSSDGIIGLFSQGKSSTSVGSNGLFSQGTGVTVIGSNGCFAQGSNTTAIGAGAFAQGGSAKANNTASWQIGIGLNNEAHSISVKDGVRIHGDVPVTPRNGDIWVNAGGTIVARSNGIDVGL